MEELDDYILDHISPEPPELARIYRDTYLKCLYPRMCSGHLQGAVLRMIVSMAAPRRIVELGTFTGYSALAMAMAMPSGGELHSVDIDDELGPMVDRAFACAPAGVAMHHHIGDALEVVPALPAPWDMAFIDADKRHYTEYYEMLLPLMRPGGYILADNTLWGGKVADPDHARDPQSQGILRFNAHVAADPRVETLILPLRDGLTILRVLPD